MFIYLSNAGPFSGNVDFFFEMNSNNRRHINDSKALENVYIHSVSDLLSNWYPKHSREKAMDGWFVS